MITCITRSMNDELYKMMLSLCPPDWKFIRVMESSAVGYLDYIFENDFNCKWVLNLDEDCFLINYNNIYEMIKYLEANNYDYSGIQDGGSVPVRIHNPLVANPYFNLFNKEKINSSSQNNYKKSKYDLDVITNKYSHFVRFLDTEYKYDRFEPFYDQFFWLLEQGFRPYFQKATPYDAQKYLVIAPLLRVIPYYNSPTMLFDHNNNEIGIHTWHSRFYNYFNIRKAINNCYQYAMDNSTVSKDKKDVQIIKLQK